jgi:perosamine synthetase
MPVHLLGHPVDMGPLLEVARRYGLVTIEDASESLGASYRGEAVGGLGDAAAFSFNANKVITCGGGGMLVTRNAEWARLARHLSTQAKVDEVESAHDRVGFNYRMTNLQAALGCAQLEQLDDFLARKRDLRARYRKGLSDVAGVSLPESAPWAHDSAWLTAIRLDPARFGCDRRALAAALGEAGIQTRPLWQTLHRSAAYAGARAIGGEVADALQEQALCLPSSAGQSLEDVDRVTARIVDVARGGSR